LKNIIFHIKLFRHFEFSRKKNFHKSFIFIQSKWKKRKIDKNIIFENIEWKILTFSTPSWIQPLFWAFTTDNKSFTIVQCKKYNTITYPKIKTFYSSIQLPKNHEFLWKKICHIEFFGHFEFLGKKIFCKRWTGNQIYSILKKLKKNYKYTSFKRWKRFDVYLKYGRHFEISCLTTLDSLFTIKSL
jgi:hypothetical protein